MIPSNHYFLLHNPRHGRNLSVVVAKRPSSADDIMNVALDVGMRNRDPGYLQREAWAESDRSYDTPLVYAVDDDG